MRHYEIGNTTI